MSDVPAVNGPLVHPSATIDVGAVLGAGTTVGGHAHIGARVVLGEDCVIAENVIVAADVSVGARVIVSPGAYLRSGLVIGDDVTIGPNAVFVESQVIDGASTTVAVGNRAAVGANASVLGAVTVGASATIGAGAVVTRDVPPYATVVGNPARVIGYRTSPRFNSPQRTRASALSEDEFPFRIGKAVLHRFPRIDDLRGSLTFGEVPTQLPFVPVRYFLVFGVPSRELRGEHAHRALHELLVCVHGECSVAVDDGTERGEIILDRPEIALHLPPNVWRCHYKYSPDAVMLALASAPYEASDYIRDYDEFELEIGNG